MRNVRHALFLAIAACISSSACRGTSSLDEGRSASPDSNDPGRGSPSSNGGSTPVGGNTPGALSPDYEDADINHVLGTGQSLSLGMMGTPPLSSTQPFGNTMFDTGLTVTASKPTAFVPLKETSFALDEPVETPSSGMANLVAFLSRDRYGRAHDLLVSLHGVSGASYPMLRKGTDAYAKGIGQVEAAKAIATRLGKSYRVRAVTVVHGESDGWQNWNKDYALALEEWQRDFTTDINRITGQTGEIPMFQSQYSAWSSVEAAPHNVIPLLQLDAHKRSGGKIVLVGPKYFLPYADDGLHLTNEGYRWLGEYYAKAYTKVVLEGRPWEPVRPREITRRSNVVTVKFHVPAPPLVLDTQLVSDPGSYGFEIHDDGGPPPKIEKVAVTAPDTVTITLSGEPRGATKRLRYAYSGVPDRSGGPHDGPRGNLRDSDATASRANNTLYNWCVHFDEPMP